ncbi:MAG: VWA domain-containing protein [Clostridiales bacterium]|nr:VWA domain-containing protein [Clostridiales bacterium]
MEDRIAKQKLNIILLVDASKSMGGKRISQVNQAIEDIQQYLINLQSESSNVDFYMTVIPFSDNASFYNNIECSNVQEFEYNGIKTGGWSNLHCAYEKLGEILKKESKGGIMPDFGGVAPIILLLTDGHPTGKQYKQELKRIENSPWYKVALRYGIAIDLDDQLTISVLHDFVGANGDVISSVDSSVLKNIIKLIVITASKVKSTSSNVSYDMSRTNNSLIQQTIAEALTDIDSLEW